MAVTDPAGSPPETQPRPERPEIERAVERAVSLTRWLLAPIYLGLAILLGMLVVGFARELWQVATTLGAADSNDLILATLSLVDLTLVATLVVMVVLLGFENFVARRPTPSDAAPAPWMEKLDPGGLKLKVSTAIVAISSIHLLKTYMRIEDAPTERLPWMVGIHLTFVATAILMALADRLRPER